MKNLENRYCNGTFSHIYVEEAIKEHPRTKQILEKFPKAECISIHHYKDVFCRKGQSFEQQHQSPALILAGKQGRLVYEGAKVCQSFGNENFYYTSCVMNCIYDCEYCYLKGMYPSGNLVIFVNLEDIFAEVEELLTSQEVYLCVSYDTDLMALEDVTEFVTEWVEFTKKHPKLQIEIRTKCGRKDLWERLSPVSRVVYAFTLSPDKVVKGYENRTASLQERIACAALALKKGFSVRLCFDPMIYCSDWKKHYREMVQQVLEAMDMDKIYDISIGSFRISKDYLKKMRRNAPNSAVVQYPFENTAGVYHYPLELMEEMEGFLLEQWKEVLPEDKIFRWESS